MRFGRYDGDMVEIWWDMMEIWWRYGGDMMEIWWRYDGDMMEVWWRYDGDMMEIWWRYGVDLQFQKTWNIVQKLYGPIVFQGRKFGAERGRVNEDTIVNWSKCQSIHNVTKIYIWIKLYSFEGCVHKWIPFLGGFHGFHKKILNWTSVFNFSNNKCYFSCKSSYQNDIWRITWYWRRVWC